jgi:hypothetical protein
MKDTDNNRPLVGFVTFNEDQISYKDGRYQMYVNNFIHEVMHALFFHPKVFEKFPAPPGETSYLKNVKEIKTSEEETLNDDGVWVTEETKKEVDKSYLIGENIKKEMSAHFDCDSHKGGNYKNTKILK